jgi:hypothetical protein
MAEYARCRITIDCILQSSLDMYIALCNLHARLCKGERMTVWDFRGVKLRALDARLMEFATVQGASADDDGASLCELATAIADSMSHWNEIMRRVRVKDFATFEPADAGALAIESVFDHILDPHSLGVLIAAFELAATP